MSVNYVEYLQGNNESYINTGVAIGIGYQIDVTFMLTRKPSTTADDAIYGASSPIFYNYDNSVGTSVCYSTNQNSLRIRDGNEGGYNTRERIEINESNCLNNKYTLSKKIKEATNTYHVYLFANNHVDTILDAIADDSLRVYDFKIYNDSNTLLIHLRPCLDTEGVPCMYDEVSKQYFHNQGTGTFGYKEYHLYLFADNNEGTAENLGSYRLYNMKIDGDSEGVESGVDYVDCLIGDGNSWIDTGIVVRNGYTIDLTFASTIDKYNQEPICGSGDVVGYTYDRFGGYGIGLRSYFVAVREIRDEANIDKNELEMTSVKFAIDEKVNFSHKFTNVNNNGSCLVMGQNYCDNKTPASPNYKTSNTVKLYNFKIYDDNDTLLIHLKPCLDEEGIPCMYDEVSGEYFENQGSGTFGYKKELRDFQPVLDSNNTPCLMDKINKKYYYSKNGNGFKYNGYTRVGYLKSDGNSYIDTGIIPTTNTKVVVDSYALLSDIQNGPALFGATDTFLYYTFQTTASWLYVSKLGIKHSVGQAGHDFTGRNVITIDLSDTTNVVNINGINYGKNEGTTTTCTSSILLWNCRDPWGGMKAGSKANIYNFKIYESNVLVLDLMPILDNDGTPCMYDLVTETFFYNQGTGEFSYGAVEELECPPVDYVGYIKNPQTAGDYTEFIKVPNMLFNETWKKIKAKYYTYTNGTSRLWEIYNGRFSLATNYGAFLFSYTNENGENKTLELFRNVGIAPDNNTMMYFDVEWTPGNFNINGMNQTYEEIAQPQSSGGGRELRLCGNRMKGGIQYFTVYGENDVILLDLHACVDDNGVACVYDTIAKDFIYPVGTNPFTAEDGIIGYTPIKYIETNGTQYIDTGVVTTDNTDIDMRARACESKTIVFDYCYTGDGHYYTPKFPCNEVNNAITNNSDHSIVADFYGDNGVWKWQGEIKSGATENLSQHSYVAVRFTAKDQINYVNDYIFIQGEQSYSSKPGNTDLVISLQDCMSIGYLMNDLIIGGTYKFKETNTNVEPNLTASAGATLTLGSTYSAFLTETEIEQAINNGWTIE